MPVSRRKLLALAAAAALPLPAVRARTSEADFSGRTIYFWIPFREGGGSDTWARFLANWMPKYLEGGPRVVVRNVAGGGAVGGANEYYRRAKQDGTDILGTAGSMQLAYLLDAKHVEYDYGDWFPVFASPFGGVVYTRSDTAAGGPRELLDTQLGFASFGATGSDLVALLAFSLLGFDTKVTFGMGGRGPVRMAIMRGEVDLDYQTTSTYLKNVQPLVDRGRMRPLFSWGVLGPEGKIERDPTFPDLPSFPEFHEMLHGEPPSGLGWDAWLAAYSTCFAYQKFVVLPKAAPTVVQSAYRTAFDTMARNPDFQSDARERLGAYRQIHGDSVDGAMLRATSMPEEIRSWLRTWLGDNYGIAL